MLRRLLLTSGLLACLGFAAPPADAQTVLRAGHISPKDSDEGMAIDRFADLVKQKTNGAVVVQVYPSEQLGKAPAEIESTIAGNQDMYFGGSPEFERYSDGLKILGLNWVVPSREAFMKVINSPIWKSVLDDPLDKAGLVVLSSKWERGPYRVMVSKKPINSVSDLKGLKFRIAPIDTWRRSWGAVGTANVVLAFNDVYMALQQGTVEAVTSPIGLVEPMKFTEVAKHIVRTDELWLILVPVMNKSKWQRLTPDQQSAVRSALDEAGAWFVSRQEAKANEDLAKMRAKGVTFSVLDTRPAAELMKPVIRQMENEGSIPKGLYDRILETIQK